MGGGLLERKSAIETDLLDASISSGDSLDGGKKGEGQSPQTGHIWGTYS